MFRIAHSPLFNHPLPPGHRFPMEKYDLIPQQLLYEGIVDENYFFEPEEMDLETIALAHDWPYIEKLKNGLATPKELRKIGFPYSPQLFEREICIMYGTVQAALFALEDGIAFNIAGGTHHAYADKGEGFCLFNDNAIAAKYLLREGKAKRILIVDLDVHQGNGTAAIFQGSEEVFTFSMHGKNNYPLHKEQSHLDIELEDQTDDFTYIDILKNALPKLIDLHKPDFIFYQSGVDILATDKLGRMSLTRDGVKERDRIILQTAHQHGIPLTASMGGGYSANIIDIVEAHCNLYRLAKEMYC
ncbi:MAG: histone deacetylase family protein [Bacteroidia bacterium]